MAGGTSSALNSKDQDEADKNESDNPVASKLGTGEEAESAATAAATTMAGESEDANTAGTEEVPEREV